MNEAKKYIITCAISAILTSVVFLGFGLCHKSLEQTRVALADSRAREQQYEELYNGARAELASARTEIEESRKLLGTIRATTNNMRESVSRSGESIEEIEQVVKDLQNYYSGIERCLNNDQLAINR